MVSKDQGIGWLICLACVVVAIVYVITLFYPSWLTWAGLNVTWQSSVQFWVVAIPVFVAFIAVLVIGAWIGWTMATTPPPKPIEEIEAEEKLTEEKEEKK
jgi:predicted DNA-binding transcriptional regulator